MSIGAFGCAGAAKRTPSAANTAPQAARAATTAMSHLDSDRDSDANNDEGIVGSGRRATGDELRAIAAAIHHYYAAAVAEDGRRACQLMSRKFAKGVPVDYGRFGAPYMHASTCPAVMRRVFAHEHRHISSEAATLRVVEARLEGDHGFALLRSRPLSVSKILFRQEGGSWKIESLMADE
ncbi:MAG: hypothetical protein ACTHM1_07410 [Solirubrobacteraceae bacterium]